VPPRDLTAPQRALLDWGAEHRRDLPWRHSRDPWAILVSEVMLQQTQVARVVERWQPFLDRWGDPAALAAAPLSELLRFWQGLGYPRRARSLHSAASACVDDHGGDVPAQLDELLALPGVGPYTASAVRVFALELDDGVVDANIGRVLARFEGRMFSPAEARATAQSLTPPGQSWEWNQMLMDLGATVCRARSARCIDCPLRAMCRWAGDDSTADPARGTAGAARPQSRFEGSDRQVRGKILAGLGAGARPRRDLVASVDPTRCDRLLDQLITEGFVFERAGVVGLVGDSVSV
jgi:A/G-specific adenine glycosylase